MPVIINGTTGISGVDGTAATPAIQGSDTNTGVFFPAADTISFTEGGVEAMRIDSSGNVGIGAISGGARLDVAAIGSVNVYARVRNADGLLDLYVLSTGDGYVSANALGKYLGLGAGGSERFRIGPAGQFGIGGATYGTSGQVLTSGGASASPSWAAANGMILLGTLTTTSGTTQTLSGLTLTGYDQLYIVVRGVSHNSGTSQTLLLGGQTINSGGSFSSTTLFRGTILVDLPAGWATGLVSNPGQNTGVTWADVAITNASTSLTFSWSGGAAFDAGSIAVYGMN